MPPPFPVAEEKTGEETGLHPQPFLLYYPFRMGSRTAWLGNGTREQAPRPPL